VKCDLIDKTVEVHSKENPEETKRLPDACIYGIKYKKYPNLTELRLIEYLKRNPQYNNLEPRRVVEMMNQYPDEVVNEIGNQLFKIELAKLEKEFRDLNDNRDRDDDSNTVRTSIDSKEVFKLIAADQKFTYRQAMELCVSESPTYQRFFDKYRESIKEKASFLDSSDTPPLEKLTRE
jgi:hypothetical protein